MCESFDLGFGKVLENSCYHMCQARMCIRICITRVPAYVKWMWQNQSCWTQQRLAFQEHVGLNQWSSISSVWFCLYVSLPMFYEICPNPAIPVEFLKVFWIRKLPKKTPSKSWWLRNHRSTSLDFGWQNCHFHFSSRHSEMNPISDRSVYILP